MVNCPLLHTTIHRHQGHLGDTVISCNWHQFDGRHLSRHYRQRQNHLLSLSEDDQDVHLAHEENHVYRCIRNWPLPIGAFQDQCKQTMVNKYSNKRTWLRIPTGERQSSWLFTSVTEKLNSGLPWTTSTSGQNGIWDHLNPRPTDFKSDALTPRPRCLISISNSVSDGVRNKSVLNIKRSWYNWLCQ